VEIRKFCSYVEAPLCGVNSAETPDETSFVRADPTGSKILTEASGASGQFCSSAVGFLFIHKQAIPMGLMCLFVINFYK